MQAHVGSPVPVYLASNRGPLLQGGGGGECTVEATAIPLATTELRPRSAVPCSSLLSFRALSLAPHALFVSVSVDVRVRTSLCDGLSRLLFSRSPSTPSHWWTETVHFWVCQTLLLRIATVRLTHVRRMQAQRFRTRTRTSEHEPAVPRACGTPRWVQVCKPICPHYAVFELSQTGLPFSDLAGGGGKRSA